MEMFRYEFLIMATFALVMAFLFPSINAQSSTTAAAPAPPPTSDGVAVDQGIAYVLMLVALVVTYIIH